MTRAFRFLLPLLLALFLAPAAAMAQTIEPWREGDRTLGADAAPVTLTVYISTTCSHCAFWHVREFPAFKAKYVDTGQVRVVFRDLPTPPQDAAVAGVVMARCVPADRYDDALGALYTRQGLLSPQRPEPMEERVITWIIGAGMAGGLSDDQMRACVGNDAGWAEAEARAQQAYEDGVRGTPAFFVNGERVVLTGDAHDLAAFDAIIQPLLAGR